MSKTRKTNSKLKTITAEERARVPDVHPQYQKFPLWLLEYTNSSDYSDDISVPKFRVNGTKRVIPKYAQPGGMHFTSTPRDRVSEGITGPFLMHAAMYLHELERAETGKAVREFDDQLGERILNVDGDSYKDTVEQAKLFLKEMIDCLRIGAYLGNCFKDLRPVLRRIREQQLQNIKDAYEPEDWPR